MEEELADYDFYTLVCKTDENIYYIGSSSNSKDRIQKNTSGFFIDGTISARAAK